MNGIKIYFARSYLDFGSDYERQCIEKISSIWKGGNILELPKLNLPVIYGPNLVGIEEELFFPIIGSSDLIVAAPLWNTKYGKYKGRFSAGVVIEIYFGLKIGLKVFELGIGDGLEFKEINIENLDEYKKNKNIKIAMEYVNEQLE
jgi:hypothetical protein